MDTDNKGAHIGIGSKMPINELEREADRTKKLKCVLTKLLSSDFKMSDDTLIEKLFTLLLQQFSDRSEKWKASDLGMYVPWLIMATNKWKTLKKCVKVFSLRIAGLAAMLTPGLKTLFESGLFKSLSNCVKQESHDQSILLGYIDCLYSIVEQDTTCNYLLEFNLWWDMIHIALNSKSLYTSRRGRQCVALFVVSLSRSHSVDKGHSVLDLCFSPLRHGNNVLEIPPSIRVSPEESRISQFPQCDGNRLIPALNLAIEIIAQLLNRKVSPQLISDLISRYRLKDWCWNLIVEENESIEVINLTSRLLAHVQATSIVKNDKGEVKYAVMRALTLEALLQLNMTAQKHMFTLVLDICLDYQTLWAKHGGNIDYSEEDPQNETWELENNLIITQCMPLFICMKVTRVMESDVMDMFADKVFTLSCKETQRVCYTYRDCLREATDRSLEALCLQGIRSFLRIPSCYTKREQAVMGFQCMMHTLKEFVPEEVNEISADCIVARKTTESLVTRFPNILSAILDGLVQFITKFRITWQDSLETVCILTFIQTLVSKKDISPMLCAKALQLAKHVISQFIPPNLALLVDTLKGSSMENLGSLLYKKINDIHWEVRDSALELLQAITGIAKAKFPAFQSLVLDSELPPLVLALVLTDPNSYVRVTALASLSEMVKIQHIWDTSLFDKRVIDQLMKCILQDTEGIVRKQGALLINDVYVHQVIPSNLLERLFDTMSYVTQKDLYGEAKLACLEFWSSVIEKSKSHQGMMDGEFPPITFSAQKKKIVTLDPPEIRLRLGHLLNSLSANGCLQVLWTSLNDDCDLSVVIKSKEIVESILHLLNKYDAVGHMTKMKHIHDYYPRSGDISITLSDLSNNPECSNSQQKPSSTVSNSNKTIRDVNQVIEEIVLSEDVDLVSRLAHCDVREVVDPPARFILPPLDFLNRAMSMDYSCIERRQIWIEETSNGLNSLLQDILASDSSTNPIDCY